MQPPLGHCYWALAPFAPAPPFRIYQEGAAPRSVSSVEPFTEAARRGASEFALLVPVKARPILVITEVLPEHEEVLALRLRRLEKLASEAERERVREGSDFSSVHRRWFSGRNANADRVAVSRGGESS